MPDIDTEDEESVDVDDASINARGYDESYRDHELSNGNESTEEFSIVEKFLDGTCKCVQAHGKPCSSFFTVGDLVHIRNENSALDYRDQETHSNKLDLIILAQMRAFSFVGGTTKCAKKASSFQHERQRSRSSFFLRGLQVCEKMFMFAHGISKKRYKRLRTIFKEDGVIEKKHGNTGRVTKKTLSLECVRYVVTFIQNYAEQNAIYLPGRWATHFNMSVKLLPTSVTKKTVFRLYEKACMEKKMRCVNIVTFWKLWKKLCPEIVVMKPKSDLCKFCQKHFTSNTRNLSLSEEDKLEIIELLKSHLGRFDRERKLYRDQITETKQALTSHLSKGQSLTPSVPCSYENACHFTFDMAQLVSIPHNPLQPGPIYFLCPFKISIFGVMNDTTKVQWNYLIPESASVSKGSSFIVSMLDHCLKHNSLGEKELLLHADNCTWQNKNNTLMAYLNYRILTGQNQRIFLSFMPVGHTKCSCDWCFGLFKMLFRITEAYTIEDVANIVQMSSVVNKPVITANEKEELKIDFWKWTDFFFETLNWTKIPLITSYSHFEFNRKKPGVVTCFKSLEDEGIEFKIGFLDDKKNLSITDDQFADLSSGLTEERKEYLFKNIREFCSDESKDILCPRPAKMTESKRGRPKKVVQQNGDVSIVPVKKRGRPRKFVEEQGDVMRTKQNGGKVSTKKRRH